MNLKPERRRGRSLVVGALVLATVLGAGALLITDDLPRVGWGCDPASDEIPRYLDGNDPTVRDRWRAVERVECDDRKETFLTALRQVLIARGPSLGHGGHDEPLSWNRQTDFRSDASVERWLDGRQVQLLTSDLWRVPVTPQWTENPFGDLSWLRTYHSLGWLQAPAQAYRDTGDNQYAREVAHYVLSWIRTNPQDAPPSRRSWYDGAVALRTDALVAYLPILLDVLDNDQLDEVLESLAEHGRTLHGYLGESRWRAHNHSLFHAMSLHNLTRTLPELEQADQWRLDARSRVSDLLDRLVDGDGVTTEQAASYQFVALRWLLAAHDYLSEHGDGFTAQELEVLVRMTRFAALLRTPGGRLPAIGDTYYNRPGQWDLLEVFDQRDLASPEARFILTRGTDGVRPPDLMFFESSGFGILRPSYGETGRWNDDLHMVVDFGPNQRVHGHNDAMNVVLTAYGEPMLIDSGGPYRYGVQARADFLAAGAHNTVIVDGEDYEDGDVEVSTVLDRPAFTMIEAKHAKWPAVEHRRAVVLLKPALIVIVDWLSATDGRPHELALLYHLDPAARVARNGDRAEVVVGSASLGISVAGGNTTTFRVREGEEDPLLGWVTEGDGLKRPAPVLSFEQHAHSTWFVTAIAPAPGSAGSAPELEVHEDGSALQITVSEGETAWRLVLEPESGPRVKRDE